MKNPFRRRKKDRPFKYRGVPVDGPKLRPATGRCPQCHANESEWCQPWCKTIDASWYRQGRP